MHEYANKRDVTNSGTRCSSRALLHAGREEEAQSRSSASSSRCSLHVFVEQSV